MSNGGGKTKLVLLNAGCSGEAGLFSFSIFHSTPIKIGTSSCSVFFFLLFSFFISTNAFSQYAGGLSADPGHLVGISTNLDCTPAYTSVAIGGVSDGHRFDGKDYLTCTPDIAYHGDLSGGQTAASLLPINCTPTYSSVAIGGNADGHRFDEKDYLTCSPNIAYSGGISAGQILGSAIVISCAPTYTVVSKGGNYDGHGMNAANYLDCNQKVAYMGGAFGGQVIGNLTALSCAPTYTTVAIGGNYDGHAKDEGVCTVVTPVCTVVPNAGADSGVCIGSSTQLQATGGSTYSWSPTTGLNDPNISNPVATPAVTTTYTVTVSDAACSLTDDVVITVNPLPTPSIAGNDPICNGGSDVLTASGGQVYGWSTGEFSTSITVSPPSNTTYTVTATNVYGCSANASAFVGVGALPAANAGSNQVICNGGSTTIGAAAVGGNTYSWTPTTGLSSSTDANPTANPTATTTYTLTETVTATGCQQSNSVTVTVNPLPAADAGSDQVICDGGSTTIGAAAVGGNTYSWTPTTNLSSSTDANPTANPTITTTYTLTETITATGCQNSNSVIVTVNPLPAANAGSNQTICNGQSTTIGAAAVGGNTYSWTPTTNLSSSTAANPTANPTTTTTYTLTETVTATGCQNSNSVIVTVNPLPAADAGSNQTICNGQSTGIGAAPVAGNTYNWTPLTSGLDFYNIANPTASPTSTTTYTLTETITATGCQKSNTVTVSVNPLPAADAGSPQTICSGQSTTIGVAPVAGNTYSWLPTTNLSSSTVSNPTASPTDTTTYTLTETITATGCQNSNSVIVTVNPLPAAYTGSDQVNCSGSSVVLGGAPVAGNTYSWSPGTGLSSTTVSNPTANPVVSTTYTLTETITATGCQKSNSVTVTIDASATPAADAGTNQTICRGLSTTIGAAPVAGNTYSWTPTTGLSSSTVSNPTASPTSTTTYTLTETVTATGCQNSNSVTVTVNLLPTADAGSNQATCDGGTVSIGAAPVGGSTYSWSPTTGLSSSTASNPTVTVGSTTTYTLTETITASGCQNSNSVTVTIYPLPAANVGSNQTICNESSTTIGAAPIAGSTYSWTPSTRLSSTTISNPTANPTATIIYTLTETNSNGCINSNAVTVTVNPLPAANAGSNQTICSGGSVTIGAAAVGGSTYSWTPATGLSSTTVSNPTANPAVTTIYTVTETNSNGCVKSNSVTVFVNPAAYITGGGVACAGSTISLVANGGCSGAPTYLWSTAATTKIISVVVPAAGVTNTYTVTVTDAGGYSSVASVDVTGGTNCTYTNVSKGGTYDGHAMNGKDYLACNVNISYAGGQAGGQITSTTNYISCTPTYTAVSKGGTYDGHAMSGKDYLFCNVNISYAGGQAGGQITGVNNYLSCTPAYASVSIGGTYDGHALGNANYLTTCLPNISYSGGQAGGQIQGLTNYLSCIPAYTSVALGSTYDGHALGGIDYITNCNTSIPYYGGQAGGQVTGLTNYLSCTPTYTSVARGGFYDGHRLDAPVPCFAALPVELLNFTATVISKKEVLCKWQTASEINSDYFTIEKTINTKDYFYVGEVSGAGNSTITLSYSFPDYHPFKGTSYYRLKQTDFDGKYKYSQLVAVNIKDDSLSKTTVSIYPNPVTELLNVYMLNGENLDAELMITDVLGRVVYSQKSSFGEGVNQFTLSTAEYREGMYFLHIIDEKTNRSISLQRFVKINEQ